MSLQRVSLFAILTFVSLVHVEGWIDLDCAFQKKVTLRCAHRDSRKLASFYDEIDKDLSENVDGENVAESLALIKKRILIESTQRSGEYALRLMALRQIHNLEQTDGHGRCTLSSTRILELNDESLRGAISNLRPGEILSRPIERLVNHFVKKFNMKCDHEVLIKRMDPEELEFVKRIVGSYISMRARNQPIKFLFGGRTVSESWVEEAPSMAYNYANVLSWLGSRGISPKLDAPFIFGWLSKLSKEKQDPLLPYLEKVDKSPDGEPIFDQADELYKKYVSKPCAQYVETLDSVFGSPWAISQSMKYHKRFDNAKQLYMNLTYYRGCSLILHNEEELFESLKEYILERAQEGAKE